MLLDLVPLSFSRFELVNHDLMSRRLVIPRHRQVPSFKLFIAKFIKILVRHMDSMSFY